MDEQEKREDQDIQEVGRRGGSMEAHMASAAYPVAASLAVPVGVVRWTSIAAGAAIALALTVLLNTLGVGFGLALSRAGYGGGLAYWMIAMAAISLFVGAYVATRTGQVRTVWTAVVHGMTVWSVFVLLDVLGVDLFGGLSRFFFAPGVAAISAGASAGAEAMRSMAMQSGWWLFVAYLIGLAAALFGAVSGVTVEEVEESRHADDPHHAR